VKTADGFFVGFPSYWNIAALYLFVLHAEPWVCVALVTTCSILTFVPTRYIYPSQGGPFALALNLGSAIWFVTIGVMLFGPADARHTVAVVSLAYPACYLALSAAVSFRGH
jgi:phosphatidylcholine synthase